MQYHAHVYWTTAEQKSLAVAIRARLMGMGYQVGRLHDEPVGPHPVGQFQVIYSTGDQAIVERVCRDMRGDASVLLHEAINDDVRDHTEGACWLGEPLELDLEWLENYTRNKHAN